MKAVIFNSGLGKRMGEFTRHNHKSQAVLSNGETIYERQIRLLSECGITDFLVTVGPFKEQLMSVAEKPQYSHLSFTFVENPVYDKTNYIYSMYLARDCIDDDVILMHGDLVFNKSLLQKALSCREANLAMVNRDKPLPDKDFKARVIDGCIREVSVNIFDEDCYAFQAMYKLDKLTVKKWLDRVCLFIENGNDQVYAENALNEISADMGIREFSYAEDFVDEVDNLDDLARVSATVRQFDFDDQPVFAGDDAIENIAAVLAENNAKKPMIVCDFYQHLSIKDYLESLDYDFVLFSSFSPNPTYEQVVDGVRLFKEQGCDFIISVGGGSAIDTAKNIKLFSAMPDNDIPYIKQDYCFSGIKHLAIPTTSGTGSESTRYSVVYYEGEKFSVTHDCIVPDYVILYPQLIATVPLFQKKCTVMDAVSQCIEAIWSVNTNSKCREYATKGLRLALDNIRGYIAGDSTALANMQIAANYSGRAINISQTTAGHAMSYKLSSLYNIPHGYAVALCLIEVWKYMADSDYSDNEVLSSAFDIINSTMGVDNTAQAISIYQHIFYDIVQLDDIDLARGQDLDILASSVNLVRLANNPVVLDEVAVKTIYKRIFRL